jgi:hypothetical protein
MRKATLRVFIDFIEVMGAISMSKPFVAALHDGSLILKPSAPFPENLCAALATNNAMINAKEPLRVLAGIEVFLG